MGPGTIGLASTQVNIFVNTWLATSQGEGPVSWLNYAFRLMQFPLGIFGVAIASATLPTVSAHVATGELEGLRKTLSSALRMVFVINIPASLGLIFLSRPIIALIYEHGKFKQTDTDATSKALIFYAIGLFAYSGIKVLVPAFYALGRSRVPVIISAICCCWKHRTQFVADRTPRISWLGSRDFAYGDWKFWTAVPTASTDLPGRLQATQIFTLGLKMLAASVIMGAVSMQAHRWLLPSRQAL